MNKRLFVAQLPWSVDDEKLAGLFIDSGKVISAKVIIDRETGRSKGFGFVEMSTDEEAQIAIQNINGSDYEGRKLVVNIARPQENKGFNDRRTQVKRY